MKTFIATIAQKWFPGSRLSSAVLCDFFVFAKGEAHVSAA
jgi:hypothetical protein